MFKNQGTENFDEIVSHLSTKQQAALKKKLEEMISYVPKVGIFGKTGAGKSTLCNTLFGRETCAVSDIAACTRDPQTIFISDANGKGISLVDLPGVGESNDRDHEYEKLYRNILPTMDVILWILKVDDRAYSIDLNFYDGLVKPYVKENTPVLFVLNQVDLIKPHREWDEDNGRPGETQEVNIIERKRYVAEAFDIDQNLIIPISAQEKYGLEELLYGIIQAVPSVKKLSIVRESTKEIVSERILTETKVGVEIGLTEIAGVAIGANTAGAALGAKGLAIGATLGGPVGAAIGAIAGVVVGAVAGGVVGRTVKKFWNWLWS